MTLKPFVSCWLVTLLFVFTSSMAYSQKKMDFGFQYGIAQKSLNLELRWYMSNDYKLRIGVGLFQYSNYASGNIKSEVIVDDVRSRRNFRYFGTEKSIRFGLERNLINPFFSVVTDLVIAHNVRQESYFTSSRKYEDGQWVPYENSADFITLQNKTTIRKDFLEPSIRFGLSMDVPLFKSFYINVYYLINTEMSFSLRESVENNVFNEFAPSDKIFKGINLSANYGVGLRYAFGKTTNK